MQETNRKHSVIIDQRKNLTISGVESVVAFSEVKILLSLNGGEKMQIIGSDLKITAFSKNSGDFAAEGMVTGITYNAKSLAARIFK